MRCVNGHENESAARFCRSCGQSLLNSGQPQSVAQVIGQSTSVQPSQIQKFKAGLLNDLQAHRNNSLATNLQSVIAMISGALYSIAVLVIAFDAVDSSYSDSPFLIGFVWTGIGCVLTFLAVRFISGELISGATVAVIPLMAMSILFLFGDTIDNGNVGLPLILLGLCYAAAWALPILRGRPSLLSSALLAVGFGVVIQIMQSSIRRFSLFDSPTDLFDSIAQESSSLLLVVGIVLLAFAWTLDRKDWTSLGRVFIGVGIVFEGIGAFGVVGASGDQTAAYFLLAASGIILIVVAVQRSRKSSLLIGGFGGLAGIIGLVVTTTENSEGPGPSVALLLLISVALGYVAIRKSVSIQNKIQSIGRP